MTAQQETLFAFGLGYSAKVLAEHLRHRHWRIIGTSRSEDGAERLSAAGFEGVIFDGSAEPEIPVGAHWLVSIPPDEDGCPAVRACREMAAQAASVTYLSTTGVYGDLQGGWAFEWTAVNPQSGRADRRVKAEAQWRACCPNVRIVRLPGIYGPSRSPFDRIKDGSAQRIVKRGQVFSRIHVEDIAAGLHALLTRPAETGVFHLCDDEAAPPQDVTAFAARLMGLEPSPEIAFEDAELSAMARSFYSECKRVSNARAKAALDWTLRYPTYRDGLHAIWSGTPIRS
ncbi:MAG: SDR family oxidoreductase [Pseudomonadota bacterium]